MLIGLIPLGLLAGIVLIAVVVTALARELTSGGGFYAQQQAALVTLIVGLVLAIVVFAIACWRVLHQVGLVKSLLRSATSKPKELPNAFQWLLS